MGAFAAAVLVLAAQDWPSWRGPKGDGSSAESGFPVRWSATENVAWKVPIPGIGHSSPIVFGDRIFLTTCLPEQRERRLLCLEASTGKLLWNELVLTADVERKHGLNSWASSTPATDGTRVFVAFLDAPAFRIFAFGMDGKKLWEKQPGKFFSVHGFCSSPVIWKDLVIFNGDQDAEAWIVGLDRETGEERWRADRPNKTRSYVPPVVFEAAGKAQLVLSGSKSVASYDPATGRQWWVLDGPTEQFVASLVQTEGIFFVTGGYPKHFLIGIKPDGEGNVTKSHELWRDTKGVSYVPSPLGLDGIFYVVSDTGTASALEAKTGKRLWSEKLGGHHSSSPVAAGGLLYFPDDSGAVHVLKAGPAFERVAKNELGEECYASPALSRGRIIIRTKGHLWCLSEGGK